MQYSNINEAWNNTVISQNYNPDIIKEHFKPMQKNTQLSCEQVIQHIKKCPLCSKKLFQHKKSPILSLFNESIEQYREQLLLILTTIFIVLLINLIIKLD